MSRKQLAVLKRRSNMPSVAALWVALVSGMFGAPWALAAREEPGSASAVAAQDPVLIRVGSQETWRASDVRDYAVRRTDLRALLNTPIGWKALTEEFALTRALVLEGQRLGIRRANETLPGVDPRVDDVYALAVFQRLAGECKAPADEAGLRRYYDTHPEVFRIPPQAHLERIVLPKGAVLDKFPAEQWLGLQARAVALSGARFEALVRRAQDAFPDLVQGDLGWIVLEGLEREPLLGAVRDAGPGGLVGPVVEGDHVYLIRVLDMRPGGVVPWEAVKHQAATRIVQHCREHRRQTVRDELFKRHEIVIDHAALKSGRPSIP